MRLYVRMLRWNKANSIFSFLNRLKTKKLRFIEVQVESENVSIKTTFNDGKQKTRKH